MKQLLASLLLALLLSAVSLGWAQTQPGLDLAAEADLHFDLGIRRYSAGDYRTALEHLLRSNRLGPNKNVIFNIARCYERLGRHAQAFRYYSEYLTLESDRRARAGALRTVRALRPHLALVRIESNPPGATIYVDRRDLGVRGRTPLTLALRPGQHGLFLELEGYETVENARVSAVRGRTREAHHDLVRIVGQLEVSGEPEGAEIRLENPDGEVVGRIPSTISLPPGPQVLVVTAPGREPVERVVFIQPTQAQSVSISLSHLIGSLDINSSDQGARVELDGEFVGVTDASGLTVAEVPAGRHQLRVTLSGFQPLEQEVSITASQPTLVDVQLVMRREVIAASRAPETLDEAPTSVTVISREEIEAFRYRTLAEAMAGVRGMYTSFDRSYHTIGFRGFNLPSTWGNRALVTMDGHTTNEDETGGFSAEYEQRLDLMNLERIEVVRGPASALYGTNALVGVINMVSRQVNDLPSPYVSVLGDGEDRMLTVSAGGGYRFRPGAGLWASATGSVAQGQDYYFPSLASETSDGWVPGVDGRQAASVTGLGWFGDFSLQLQYNGRDKQYPTAAYESAVGDERSRIQEQRGFVELRWTPQFNQIFSLMARLYLDWYDTSTVYPYEADPDDEDDFDFLWTELYQSSWMGGEVRGTAQLPFWRTRLALGSEIRGHLGAHFRTISEPMTGGMIEYKPKFQVYSVYAQGRAFPLSWFWFSLGVRFEYFSLPDFPVESLYAISPHVALFFRASPRDIFKLIAATAFRAPTPTEFFSHDYGETQFQAEDLEPERVYSAELEYTHRFTEELSLTGSVFFNYYDDLIDLALLEGAAREAYQYQNSNEQVQTFGGEVEFLRVWRQGWMASVSYSYQRTRSGTNLFRNSDGAGESTRISNSPEHLIAVSGAAPLIQTFLTLASRIRVESPRYARDLSSATKTEWAMLWDIILTGKVPRAHLSYAVGVRNLLDWQYSYPTGSDLVMLSLEQPRRNFFASLTLQW
jgi:outer membrane receptor protein involved in Fe transport